MQTLPQRRRINDVHSTALRSRVGRSLTVLRSAPLLPLPNPLPTPSSWGKGTGTVKSSVSASRIARLGCALGLTFLAQAAQAEDGYDFWQHFRMGAAVVFNIKANFNSSGQFNLNSAQAGAAGVSGVNHVYDDGYVKVDQTGNAQGFTSFWGYNGASQFNAANHTLTMHSTSSYASSDSESANNSPFYGFEAAYGNDPWRWGKVRIGWEVGVGLLPISISANTSSATTVNQSVFSFDTGGIVMPTAPYNGGPSGIGPTIHDTAAAQGSSVVPGVVTGTRKLDVILYTLRLGPTVSFDLSQWLSVTAGAGPALGIVDGDYKFSDNIVTAAGIANNSGKSGFTKTVYGGYVNAALLYHVQNDADIFIGAQFMPLGNASFSGGGRSARLDLGGAVEVNAGINWPF